MSKGVALTKRLGHWASAGVLAVSAIAVAPWSDARADALVEFASFDCPHCRAISAHHDAIEQAADRAGLRFVYAPLPPDADLESAWRERAYYAARELPGKAEAVRQALLAAQDSAPLENLDAVVAWLDMHVPDVRWGAFAADRIDHSDSLAALERAVRLARRAGVRSYPAFVLVTGEDVRLLPLEGDADARATALIEHLEER